MRPPTPADPARIGPHEVLARLGAGGMGEVLLVRTPADGLAALKVVRGELAHDPGFRARFAREVRAAQRVRGPHTPAVLSADPEAAVPWMATEYVPGPTLREAVREHGPFPEGSLRVLALGLARALQAVHAAGLMHRDLKPGNVLLSPRGPQVIDFGIARAVEGTVLTRTGQSFGTPAYASPEQVIGGDVGSPSDVFSLAGAVVYAATGRPPFGSGKAAELLARVVDDRADLDGVPEGLRPLLERCLAKDPAERPTADELVQILSAEPLPSAEHGWLPAQVHQPIEAHRSDTRAALDAVPPSTATGPGSGWPDGTAEPGDARSQGSGPAPLTPPPGGRGRTALIAGAAALAVVTMVGTVGLLAASPWPGEDLAGEDPGGSGDSEDSGEHGGSTLAGGLSPVFDGGLSRVAFAADGKSVYVAGGGRLVQVGWETGEELAGVDHQPNNLAVGPDGSLVASYSNSLAIWGPDLEITHDFQPPRREAWNSPSLTADGTRLSVSAVDGEGSPLVQVWNLEAEEVEFEFATEGHGNDPVINADGTLLYANETTNDSTAGGLDRRATVWDLTTGEAAMEFPNEDIPDVPVEEGGDWPELRYADFHPADPSVLAVKTSDSDLALYDLSTGEVLRLEAPDPEQGLYEIHFSADGSRLAASGGTERDPAGGHVWDTATGALLTGEPVELYSQLAFHPDGEVIVSLTPSPDNDRFIVLDGETFEIRHEFPG